MRRSIWEGRSERITLDETEDGSVVLIHSTDHDSGPAKSLAIPPEALGLVAGALWALSINRTFRAIGEQFRRARIIAGRAHPGDLPETEE